MKWLGTEGDDFSGNPYLWRMSCIFQATQASRVKGGQRPGGAWRAVLHVRCKLSVMLNNELKQKGLSLIGFPSPLNRSLLQGVLTNVFPI